MEPLPHPGRVGAEKRGDATCLAQPGPASATATGTVCSQLFLHGFVQAQIGQANQKSPKITEQKKDHNPNPNQRNQQSEINPTLAWPATHQLACAISTPGLLPLLLLLPFRSTTSRALLCVISTGNPPTRHLEPTSRRQQTCLIPRLCSRPAASDLPVRPLTTRCRCPRSPWTSRPVAPSSRPASRRQQPSLCPKTAMPTSMLHGLRLNRPCCRLWSCCPLRLACQTRSPRRDA